MLKVCSTTDMEYIFEKKKSNMHTIYFSKKTEAIVTSREVLLMRSSEIRC